MAVVQVLASRKQRSIFEGKLRMGKSAQGAATACSDAHGAAPGSSLRVVVAEDTLLYRYLAKTLVHPEDCAFEVGSSYGYCTAILAARARRAVGIDIGQEVVDEARRLHPAATFLCGDIFADLAWLHEQSPADCTALFLDINGNRNYKPVVAALRVCLQVMPALRLVVVKSKELRSFLLHNGLGIILRDLANAPRSGDEEVAAAVMQAARTRGGDVPVHLLNVFNPEVRFLIGRQRIMPFLEAHPCIEVFKVTLGPEELRCRVRLHASASQGVGQQMSCVDPGAALTLLKDLRKCFASPGVEKTLRQTMSYVRRNVLMRFVVAFPKPAHYHESSDEALDADAPERWSESWQFVVSMRHLHSFLVSRPDFEVQATGAGSPTVDELRGLRVTYVGVAEDAAEAAEACSGTTLDDDLRGVLGGRGICFQLALGRVRSDEAAVEGLEVDVEIEREWRLD